MADINLGVGGANSAVAEGYTIDNSFVQEYNSTRTVEVIYGGFGGNTPTTTKGTISFWFKWGALNGGAATWKLLNVYNSQISLMPEGGTYDSSIYVAVYNEAVLKLVSTAKFRDTSAWYHICAVFDTTLSTASDRVKIYINGVRITDWSTANYPSQNADLLLVKENTKHFAGHNVNAGKPYGYYADMYYIHNQAKDVTDFGEFDADTGIWKPIEYTGTFGTYGYYWDFSNTSNYAEDQSGNNNDGQSFNTTAAMQSTDTPTNNFCIPQVTQAYSSTDTILFTEGGTKLTTGSGTGWRTMHPTMSLANGKWYFEVQAPATNPTSSSIMIAITPTKRWTESAYAHFYAGQASGDGLGWYLDSTRFRYDDGTAITPPTNTLNAGDIIGIALDMDNNFVYSSINGSWLQNQSSVTGVPTSGVSGTGAETISDEPHMIGISMYSPSKTININYGGYTTISIASGNSDANGYGNFEYAPPSGYYALCSKNLAEFG